MRTLEELVWLVGRWAEARNLILGSTPMAQFGKTLEECSELCVAINANDREAIKDAIGDILVTLTIQARMQGMSITDCLAAAYEQIKDRKGRMINGVFVKDE